MITEEFGYSPSIARPDVGSSKVKVKASISVSWTCPGSFNFITDSQKMKILSKCLKFMLLLFRRLTKRGLFSFI